MTTATQAGVPVHRHGTIAPELLAQEIEFAVGGKVWRNKKLPRGTFIDAVTQYQIGPKEGTAVLQGPLVKDNGSFDPNTPKPEDKKSDRRNGNVRANYQMNFDYETGTPLATFVGGHGAQCLEQVGDRAGFAERGYAHRFQGGHVGCSRNGGGQFGLKFGQIGHVGVSYPVAFMR